MMADGQVFGKVANAIKSGISAQACAAKIIKAIRLKKMKELSVKALIIGRPLFIVFFRKRFERYLLRKTFVLSYL